MAVLHTIKAWLYENLLTEDQNDYAARVSAEVNAGVSVTFFVDKFLSASGDRGIM
jgi:hypothetical protein